jgi:hypothetical protein
MRDPIWVGPDNIPPYKILAGSVNVVRQYYTIEARGLPPGGQEEEHGVLDTHRKAV